MQPGAGQHWVNSSGGWLVVALALAALHKAPFYCAVRSLATRTVLLCPEEEGTTREAQVQFICSILLLWCRFFYVSFLCRR